MPSPETAAPWIEAVAGRADRPTDEVAAVLAAAAVTPTPSLPAAPHLRLVSLDFSGTFSNTVRDGGPFTFAHEFDPSFNVFGSDTNSTGKSSILEIVFWALRGRPRKINDTVHHWLEHVTLRFEVGGAAAVVDFDIDRGRPHGTLQYGTSTDSFGNEETFKAVMGDFMMSRLGLVRASSFNKRTGSVVTNAWNAYSGGLYVPNTAHEALLGEHLEAGLAGRLLLMFVGVPWSPTAWMADAAAKEMRQQRAESARRGVPVASAR